MSEEIKTGGPAFPFKCQGPTTAPEFYYGMTLRDYFASKAMREMNWGKFEHSLCAETAYKIADAMLAARRKQP